SDAIPPQDGARRGKQAGLAETLGASLPERRERKLGSQPTWRGGRDLLGAQHQRGCVTVAQPEQQNALLAIASCQECVVAVESECRAARVGLGFFVPRHGR